MDFVPTDIEELRLIALGYAMKKGMERVDAEDFAQYVCLHYTRQRKASIRQLFIDYWRESQAHGKYGTTQIPLDSLPNLPAECFSLEDYSRIVEAVDKGRDRLIVNLYFVWGLTQAEIAEAAGYTHARVSQILRRALRAVQDRPLAASTRGH